MADSYIQVASDSTGKKLQTFKSTVGADEVHAEAVSLVRRTGDTYATTPYRNQGTVTNAVVKNSAGQVFSLACFNANASSRYIQLFDRTSAPSANLASNLSFLVPTNSQTIVGTDYFTSEGANFTNGITFGFSTDRNNFVSATPASDQSVYINYI